MYVGCSGAGRIFRLYGCRGEEQRVRHRHSGRMKDNTSVCSGIGKTIFRRQRDWIVSTAGDDHHLLVL